MGKWGELRGVPCVEPGCDKPARCKERCDSHYGKWRRAQGVRPPSALCPDKRRAARLKYRYGLAAGDYERLLEAQGGCCAICREPPTVANTRAHWNGKLCVDHDHASGKIRGLLCNSCNLMVGYCRDRPGVLQLAAVYLG